jgi:hypothetical protein
MLSTQTKHVGPQFNPNPSNGSKRAMKTPFIEMFKQKSTVIQKNALQHLLPSQLQVRDYHSSWLLKVRLICAKNSSQFSETLESHTLKAAGATQK